MICHFTESTPLAIGDRIPQLPISNCTGHSFRTSSKGSPHRIRVSLDIHGSVPLTTSLASGQGLRKQLADRCKNARNFQEAKRVHDDLLKSGTFPDIFLENTVINMYVRCGSLHDAILVFESMSEQNVFSYTLMLAGYVKYGRLEEAISLFWEIQRQGITVDDVALVTALNACAKAANLEQGKLIHCHIIMCGMNVNIFVYNALVYMYCKCGSMVDALHVFDHMDEREVISFNAIISAAVQSGKDEVAFEFFHRMLSEGLQPDEVTLLCILKSCSNLLDVQGGVQIHILILESGYESNPYIGSMLVDFYAKNGDMDVAYRIFNKIPERDVVSWNAMIAGYANHGQWYDAMKIYTALRQEGIKPDEITFVNILNAFVGPGFLEYGRCVHAHAVEFGKELDVSVGNSLIYMYGKCEALEDAVIEFSKLNRNTVSWNTLIAVYNSVDLSKEAIRLFEMMKKENMKPNDVTFVSLIHACSLAETLEEGKLMHYEAVCFGCDAGVRMRNTLIDMYIRIGCVEDALQVFSMTDRDPISWNVVVSGYIQLEQADIALEMFQNMRLDGINPSEVSFINALSACASMESLQYGFEIHADVIKAGFESNTFIGSTIVDMYVKCHSMSDARDVFEKMSVKCTAAWNSIIAGYGDTDNEEEALSLFFTMQTEKEILDEFTFVSVLNACASMCALEEGQSIYSMYVKWGFSLNVYVASALVDMHAKCGHVEDARYVFENVTDRDLFLWTVMISGYAQHGHYQAVLELWEMLLLDGIKPDDIIYVSVLSACSHVGMVDKGIQLFKSMIHDHGITPNNDHFACFVDLLGRAGCLNEAEHIIKELPIQPDAAVWRTLLGACLNHGNVELAKVASDELVKLEPEDPAAYVFLSNMYAKDCVIRT